MNKEIKLDKEMYKILLAFADNDMSVNAITKKVYLTNTAIYNRFKKIEEKTGLNPLRFWDLVQLLESEVTR